jgi:hypothetical protein
MIISGFEVHLLDIQQLLVLDKNDPQIQKWLDLIPLGSNYHGNFTDEETHEVTNVYIYRSKDPKYTFRHLTSLKYIDDKHKVIISEYQYNSLDDIIRSNPGIVIEHEIIDYDYNTDDVRGISIKAIVLKSITEMSYGIDARIMIKKKGYDDFFNSIPLGSNYLLKHKFFGSEYGYDDSFPETYYSMYELAYTLPYFKGWDTHMYHRILLTEKQYDDIKNIIQKEISNGNMIKKKDIEPVIHYNNIVAVQPEQTSGRKFCSIS